LASLEKYRYLAEKRENDNIDDWTEATRYFLKDTMTLLKVQPMVGNLQNLVDKIRWT